MNSDFWPKQVVIAENNFVYKSLSNFSCNIAVGCEHACRFCYVPDASANKLGRLLASHGVKDPDAEWGDYVLLRQWDPLAFDVSLKIAEHTRELKADGNRAVMFCSTTDAYQVIRNDDLQKQKLLNDYRAYVVREALRRIRDKSTLNVRILTRSPLAMQDCGLMKSFGHRLLFGMSLPTLRNDLARIYEPHAPSPSRRLEALKTAKQMGLNVYVAVAPVYPECDAEDMKNTLQAVKELDPVTIFMEPINIRAQNVARIAEHARTVGVEINTEVFESPARWREYALDQLQSFEEIADQLGLYPQVHLWPDKSLGSAETLKQFEGIGFKDSDGGQPLQFWLENHWSKISAWPKEVAC